MLPQDADAFLARCRDGYGLAIGGLMCIPPADEAPAPHFALTAKIAARNGLKLLSMGMSADYAIAIAMGATHVRVGSAIFGARADVPVAAGQRRRIVRAERLRRSGRRRMLGPLRLRRRLLDGRCGCCGAAVRRQKRRRLHGGLHRRRG